MTVVATLSVDTQSSHAGGCADRTLLWGKAADRGGPGCDLAKRELLPAPDDGRTVTAGGLGGVLSRGLVGSAAGLAAVVAGFVVLAAAGVRPSPELSRDVDTVLTTTTAAMLVPAAVFFMLRSRHESRQASLAMATGALMLSLGTLGVAELSELLTPDAEGPFEAIRLWSIVGALAAFSLGICDDPAERRCRRLTAAPAALLLASVALALVPGQGWTPHWWLVQVSWLTVVVAHALAYFGTGQTHRSWVALGLGGLLLGELGRAAVANPELWVIETGVVRILGVLAMLAGLVGDLELRQWRSREQLASTTALMAELREISAAAQRSMEERDHEARSALAAIEYTAHALQKLGSQVRREDVEQLEQAMLAEIALLRRLVTMSEPAVELEPFDVATTVRGVVAANTATGLAIQTELLSGLVAIGSAAATAEVVQCLLENAKRHAPGSPVRVAATRRGPYVVIQVDDQGPGVPEARRAEIFKRGRDGGHPTSAGGRGLGLYIAARLAREQRGELWVQEAVGGGASFRLALGAGAGAAGASDPAQHVLTMG